MCCWRSGWIESVLSCTVFALKPSLNPPDYLGAMVGWFDKYLKK